jgi:nucleoside-diphosphate-sugar epimerase
MKIAVTGSAGFIGSRVAERLCRDGNQVVGIDVFSDLLYPSSQKHLRIDKLNKLENFCFHECDIASPQIIDHLEGVEVIINEAGLPGQSKSWSNFEAYAHSNLVGINNLIEVASTLKIKKFIQASTSSVYGRIAVGSETAVLSPYSPYGVTKLAAEQLLLAYFHNTNFPVTVLRYFSVYGPGQRPDMAVSKFLTALVDGQPVYIHGDGTQLRDITFVDDVVNATISAIDNGRNGQVYNISGGHQISLLELLEECQKIVGKRAVTTRVDRPQGDQDETHADSTKAHLELGFDPLTSLNEGLKLQLEQIRRDKDSRQTFPYQIAKPPTH